MRKIFYLFAGAAALLLMSCGTEKKDNSADMQKMQDSINALRAQNDSLQKAQAVAQQNEQAQAEVEAISAFLRKIYTTSGSSEIFEDSWVKKHCSPACQKYLRDQYDYDGEGYGSWIIGGWGEGEDIATKCTGITHDDAYYYATLVPDNSEFDTGCTGKRVIRFEASLVNGTVVINSVKWVKDFTRNY